MQLRVNRADREHDGYTKLQTRYGMVEGQFEKLSKARDAAADLVSAPVVAPTETLGAVEVAQF